MKTLIIYLSIHHGNTEKVAKVMAKAIGADLVPVNQAAVAMVEQYDLIGFGSGIYFGKHHKSLLNFVDRLPPTRNKKAFVFSTSGQKRMPLIHDFSKPLREKLQQKSFEILGEFSCRGYDTFGALRLIGGINKGRPNTNDLKRAEDFGKALKERLLSCHSAKNKGA